MTDLTKLTIAEAREGLRKKEFTAPELPAAIITLMFVKNRKKLWSRPKPVR